MKFLEIENLLKETKIAKEKILYNEPMNKHTTFKIGGPAECLIKIDNIEDLKEIINLSNKNKIPITVIGNGSNILVLDKGIKGITAVIKINNLEIQEKDKNIEITVGAGEKLGKIARDLPNKSNLGIRRIIRNTWNHRWSSNNECWCTWERNKRHYKKCKMHGLPR